MEEEPYFGQYFEGLWLRAGDSIYFRFIYDVFEQG